MCSALLGVSVCAYVYSAERGHYLNVFALKVPLRNELLVSVLVVVLPIVSILLLFLGGYYW